MGSPRYLRFPVSREQGRKKPVRVSLDTRQTRSCPPGLSALWLAGKRVLRAQLLGLWRRAVAGARVPQPRPVGARGSGSGVSDSGHAARREAGRTPGWGERSSPAAGRLHHSGAGKAGRGGGERGPLSDRGCCPGSSRGSSSNRWPSKDPDRNSRANTARWWCQSLGPRRASSDTSGCTVHRSTSRRVTRPPVFVSICYALGTWVPALFLGLLASKLNSKLWCCRTLGMGHKRVFPDLQPAYSLSSCKMRRRWV